MRQTAMVLAAVVAMVSQAAAQTKDLTVGPTAGFNFATVTGDNQEGNKKILGLRLGGFARLALSRTVAIQPEVALSAKGTDFENGNTIRIRYLEVPVLARLQLGSGRVAPVIVAGPAIGLKVGCTLYAGGQNRACTDQTTAVAGTDAGVVLGIGVAGSRLGGSVRYHHGVSNINGDGLAKVHNRALTVAVEYGFKLRR